jgi:GxxExxY protein
MKLRKTDLIYPELSYAILGCAFDVHNQIGPGQLEKTYQKAFRAAFASRNIPVQEQVYYPVVFQGEVVGKNYFDFLVDARIIVEIKKGALFSRANIEQVSRYLQSSGLKLAILINFGVHGVSSKRVVNDS